MELLNQSLFSDKEKKDYVIQELLKKETIIAKNKKNHNYNELDIYIAMFVKDVLKTNDNIAMYFEIEKKNNKLNIPKNSFESETYFRKICPLYIQNVYENYSSFLETLEKNPLKEERTNLTIPKYIEEIFSLVKYNIKNEEFFINSKENPYLFNIIIETYSK
jgi:hypothetical protein